MRKRYKMSEVCWVTKEGKDIPVKHDHPTLKSSCININGKFESRMHPTTNK